MFFAGLIGLVYNEKILAEYKDVLHRPYLRISTDDADIILDASKYYGESVESIPSVFPMVDEDNRIFYDTAKNSGAYLVTGNTRHYPDDPFILTPAEFLRL